jgi:sialate O-acetylesterase
MRTVSRKIGIINESLVLTILLLLSILISSSIASWAQNNEKKYVSLSGKWKFSIGDNKKFSQPGFNDNDWEEIYAPSPWEDQGFNGYDGYAWYRKHFYCPSSLKGKMLYLHLGYIDDVDEVFINGKLVGSSGRFPPLFQTAYNASRRYPLPLSLLNVNGDNLITIRVYDSQFSGGIVSGDLGIFALDFPIQPDIALEGLWKFHLDDDLQWKEKNFNDKDWNEILVPSNWESQGYPDYDGYAWYRKKFSLPDYLKTKTLVLLMGKIDDKDEVYFNGRLIGSTGNVNDTRTNDWDWQRFRGYYIPPEILQKENTIAVRVYDGYINGGIYEGPIGIMTHEKYNEYWKVRRQRVQKHQKNFWELIFGG